MQRLANGTQVASYPAAAALVGTPGYGTNGNVSLGPQASVFDADQYNRIQEEICSVVTSAGIALDGGNNAQLLASLMAMFEAKLTYTPSKQLLGSIGNPGYVLFPIAGLNLILQFWRSFTVPSGGASHVDITLTFPETFPTALLGYCFCASDENAVLDVPWQCCTEAVSTSQIVVRIATSGGIPTNYATSGFVIGY